MKFFLKSLISNKTVLEGRNKKWWIGVIVLLLSLILSIIPTMVSVGTSKGSAFTNNNMLSSDVGLKEFAKDLTSRNINLSVQEVEGASVKKQLILTLPEDGSITVSNDTPIYEYTHNDGSEENVRLKVYYRDESASETTNFISNTMLKDESHGKNEDGQLVDLPISFLVLGREHMFMAVYAKYDKDDDNVHKEVSWSRTSSRYAGNYTQIKVNTNIKNLETLDLWKGFFDDGYLSLRSSTLLLQTGAYLGINLLVILFMGLMIFIVTRGKNNPFRSEYNFGKAMLVVFFAALCPAILTCAIGFALPQYAPMIFMITLGFRCMWMTSKNLNPAIAGR